MKKFLSLLFAVVLIALTFTSCSLTIKNTDTDSGSTDTGSGDTNLGIIPGENELPALPINPPSSDNGSKTVNLQFTYAYDHKTLAETGEKLASLLVEGSYLMDGFGSVVIPDDAAAGDIISIKHTGEIITSTSHPGMTNLKNGTLKSYSIKYAEVIHLTDEEINAEEINSEYDFFESYVIIDKVGRYVSLDEYKGEDLYLVLDQKRIANLENGNSSADDSPVPIACLLAYNPRNTEN